MLVSIRMAAALSGVALLVSASLAWGQAPAQRDTRPVQGPAPAPAASAEPVSPQRPSWWPQSPAHQKYVDDVLNYWEQSSSKIERYRCEFTRWEYDSAWGPKPDPKTGKRDAIRISYGEIKYGKPDKGLFKVNKVLHYTPPKAPNDRPQYLPQDGEQGDHWVCDGENVYEFIHEQKKLIVHELPPDMRGEAVTNGPLPFVFGANAAKIKERYWVGVFTPPTAKGEYWLEAWPKYPDDAKNYKKVEIIIDETDFLPKAIQIYDRSGDERNPSSTVLTFENREVNFTVNPIAGLVDPLKIWHREFYEPKTPFGYKKEVVRFDAASGQTASRPRTQASRVLPQIPLRKE